MADNRRDAGLVQVAGNEDGGVGIGVIVSHHQLERSSGDSTRGVDLLRGQLRGQLHGCADGVAEGSGDADQHRALAAAAAGQQQGREDGGSQAGRI
jgi:hypothetical protein